jgi:hypothetical protein
MNENSEPKKTVVETRDYDIPVFKHVRIGDPMYFDEMKRGDINPALKELTCDFIVKACTAAGMRLTHITYTEEKEDFSYGEIEVDVWEALDAKTLNVYRDYKWFGKGSLKEEHQLGCDTARFNAEIDDRLGCFDTGADGIYGLARKFKTGYGAAITLYFDDSLYTMDEVEQNMKELFGVK